MGWRGAVLLSIVVRPALSQQVRDTAPNFGWQGIAIGAVSLGALSLLDAPVARAVHGHQSVDELQAAQDFARFGEVSGIGGLLGAVTITGLVAHRPVLERAALQALKSVVVASIVTQAGKHAIGRLRPYADPDLDSYDFRVLSGDPSFPSGHTTAAFAMAASLGDASGNTPIRIGLYALATATGVARVVQEDHWTTDVLAGAVVGIVSAKWVNGRLRFLGIQAPRMVVGANRVAMSVAMPWVR
jgi:membrane-associated phospholipid phosphatase